MKDDKKTIDELTCALNTVTEALEQEKKKYQEALERARELIVKWIGKNKDFYVEDYTYIFPELRESEDERIREWLIKTVHLIGVDKDICADQEAIDKAIAWLEKQKEQKPAEWGDEDERTLVHIQSHLKYLIEHRFEIKDYNTMEDKMILESEIKWLENHFKSIHPVKQEWSEEDESELTAVIYCVSRAIKASKDENERSSLLSAKKWLQDKLSFRVKSLRPSWKPNEEQIKALEGSIEIIRLEKTDSLIATVLESLYEQLKKL